MSQLDLLKLNSRHRSAIIFRLHALFLKEGRVVASSSGINPPRTYSVEPAIMISFNLQVLIEVIIVSKVTVD